MPQTSSHRRVRGRAGSLTFESARGRDFLDSVRRVGVLRLSISLSMALMYRRRSVLLLSLRVVLYSYFVISIYMVTVFSFRAWMGGPLGRNNEGRLGRAPVSTARLARVSPLQTSTILTAWPTTILPAQRISLESNPRMSRNETPALDWSISESSRNNLVLACRHLSRPSRCVSEAFRLKSQSRWRSLDSKLDLQRQSCFSKALGCQFWRGYAGERAGGGDQLRCHTRLHSFYRCLLYAGAPMHA